MTGKMRAMPPANAVADRPAQDNVVPLRRTDDSKSAPSLRLAGGGRPAPPPPYSETRLRLALILFVSFAVHCAPLAFLRLEPEITASIGENVITVEIVVGAEAAAGTAQARNDVEQERPTAMDTRQDDAAQERAIKQEETRTQDVAIARDEVIPPLQKEVVPPERNVEEAPPEPRPPDPSPPQKPTPSTASAPAASSIGRGRMTAGDANYQGLVAARLARFKRFPPEARWRREQGSAMVSFTIDGAGRVTSVRLMRGTGFAALDDEVQAMVARASPFPPPPRGAEMSFTAPVSFHLN